MVATSPPAGRLIALEGIDGCGKTTQAERLATWLGARHPGRTVELLREPGGTAFGEGLRELLLRGAEHGPTAEMLLYMASRAELYESRVLPLLAAGGIALLDRSHYSTAAYQGAGLQRDEAAILELAQLVTGGRQIDRVLLLDIDPQQAAERLEGDSDRIERRGLPYFERVARAYRRYAAEAPGRFVMIDARQSPDSVFAAIRRGLDDVL